MRSNPKDAIMRSILRKEQVARSDFDKGKVNAGVIFLSESFMKSAAQLGSSTRAASPKLSPRELKGIASYAYYVQLPDQPQGFKESSFYVRYEGKERPKKVYKV